MVIAPERIEQLLKPYGVRVDLDISAKFNKYIDLLISWNRKISLTTVTNPQEIVRFHFGESLFALNYLEIMEGRLADVGSGAGFPGLALKLLRPEIKVTLLEPNKKKCAFLAEVVRTLNLSSVNIISTTFQESAIPHASLDFVVSRALGKMKELANWAKETLSPHGQIVYWTTMEGAELLQKFPGWEWRSPGRIPLTTDRVVLAGIRE